MLDAWIQILIFVAAALVANLLLFIYGWRGGYSYTKSPLLPPGWMIGLIWMVLFGFFGYAHYLVYKKSGFCVASIAIIVVALFCLLYTLIIYYKPEYMKLLNMLSLILAFTLGIIVFAENEDAFWWLIPLIVWSSYVNLSDSVACVRCSMMITDELIETKL